MAKQRRQQPQVRKPLLVAVAAAVGVALIALVLTFVVGGGPNGSAPPAANPSISTPAPKLGGGMEPTLRPGGRNPFQPVVNTQPAAPQA